MINKKQFTSTIRLSEVVLWVVIYPIDSIEPQGSPNIAVGMNLYSPLILNRKRNLSFFSCFSSSLSIFFRILSLFLLLYFRVNLKQLRYKRSRQRQNLWAPIKITLV